jgi:tetratricopeptide (TPR) repeat protein
MFLALLLSGALLGADDTPPAAGLSAKPAIETYQAARARAGKNAADHVRLALWCEAHGLSAERIKHLALAVLYDPSNALARGLLGMVAYHGKWLRPEVVGRQIQNDPAYQALIREYLDRRARTAGKAHAQLRLAAWCGENGLEEQAQAHYGEVIRLDPSRESAWRHLGYRRQGHRWVKPEDASAEKLEADRQKLADKQWKLKLEKLRESVLSKDAARRARAEPELAELTDPRAVPMIWALFGCGSERLQIVAVRMLGQIDSPSASIALAALAVINRSADVRVRATETLARRDPRDVVGRLIGLIRQPIKYHVRPSNGPGSTGVLFVEGERFNVQRIYETWAIDPSLFSARFFTTSVPFDPFSAQNLAMAGLAPNALTPSGPMSSAHAAAARRDLEIAARIEDIRESNQIVEQRLAMDVQALEATNAEIREVNQRVVPLLKTITGQDMGVEPGKWRAWWTDQLGYVYQSSTAETKPTYTEFIIAPPPGSLHSSCFAAGTSVQTVDGPRAIESIRVGDRVLSQNTSTGLLSFQPVMVLHRNERAPTLRIAVGDETIVATGIHRFWKAGKGWTMARELKPGDRLRIVGGVTEVRSVENDKAQPVYNLDIAGNRDFFVGTKGLLAHDFSLVQPVPEQFDRQPDLEARPVPTQ